MTKSISLPDLQELFPELDSQALESIAQTGLVKEYAEGETIIQYNQAVRSTMLLLEGHLKMYREGEEGDEFFVYHLRAGQACMMSVLCALQRQSMKMSAKTASPSRLLLIPIETATRLMQENTSWSQFVLRGYRSRFEELLEVIDNIAFKSMDERLEFYLKRQFSVEGKRLRLTHQQIAYDLASSREVISRLLKNMEKLGLIELQRNAILRKKL